MYDSVADTGVMVYEDLRSRLRDGLGGGPVATLPDGSVDRYYTVTDAAGRIQTQAAFLDRIDVDGARSFQLVPDATYAGGQAVNTARQVDALGGQVRLYGHLDADELGPFPFPTVSLGSPATVNVLSFDREELMLSIESADICEWSLDRLFEVAEVSPDEWVDDAVVVLQNWAGIPGMTDAVRQLAQIDIGSGSVVFDPGDISATPVDSLVPLCDALRSAAETVPVVLTADDDELAALAAALDVGGRREGPESRLRSELGIEAVVRHAERRAVAAVGEGDPTVVENFEAKRVVRRAGAGDRFDGGLAAALAADLPTAQALALGNACATYYVEHGETATCENLRALLDSRPVDP